MPLSCQGCQRCRSQHGQITDPHTGCSTPLISLLESARKGTLTAKEAAESIQHAIKLLQPTCQSNDDGGQLPTWILSWLRWWKMNMSFWCCDNAIQQVLWPESQGPHGGNQITEENLPTCHREPVFSEGPSPNVLGRWHLQGQRRTQEVQDPSVRKKNSGTVLILVCKI